MEAAEVTERTVEETDSQCGCLVEKIEVGDPSAVAVVYQVKVKTHNPLCTHDYHRSGKPYIESFRSAVSGPRTRMYC